MQPATTTPPKPKRRPSVGAILWFLLFLALGLAYVRKELEVRSVARAAETTSLDLRLANLHRQLGVASHEAQRNNFASAAAAARVFFDGCRAAVYEGDFEDRPRTKLALQAYASQSDTLLGELANGDPVTKEKLASLYLTMNGLLERRQ
jgi:hypothetical protein